MRRTKEKAELTRKHIISAAIKVMNKQGIARSRFEDIAIEANVTRGAIYHYFKNKNEILYAIHESGKKMLVEIFEKYLSDETDPILSIKNGFREVFRKFSSDPEYRAIEMLFLKAQFTSFITDDNKLDSLFKKERKQTLEKLKFIVRSGQEKGSIRKDMDPENIVFALVSIYIGLITTWFFDLEEFNINEIAEDYLDILMNGILK